jgi:D-alanyl-D-alanine carboxypeptidase/tRNA A-37 threonylcarbamoyl transferase component Bud32
MPAQPDSTITLPLPTDHLLKGRYRLLGRIGQGGMGIVYRAEDTHLGNRIVAIKEMSAHGLSREELAEATQAFQREALLLAQLNHPNLPHIYEQLSESNRWYLVMDYIEGETLETYLARAPGGRLSVQETLQLGMQLASVLSYLHSRQPPIIFRDLKPSNIMLTLDGRLYLIDFGIARIFKPGQSQDTTPFGSSGYAAPEQYGKAQTTPQADIFSLGATLHQLLSGNDPSQTPFVFAPLRLNGPGAGLEALIRRMVETDRTRRPASMEEVRRELQRLASPQTNAVMQGPPVGGPPTAPFRSRPSGLQPPGSRSPAAPARLSFGSRLPRPSVQGYIVGVVLIIFIIMIPLSIPLISSAFSGGSTPVAAAPTATPTPTQTPTPLPTATDTPGPSPTPVPFVNGEAEYLVDAGTGAELYAANIHQRLPLASTTKIMTAIIALENGGDLNQIVPITQDELNEVPPGASTAQLVAGDDNITLLYLLYGLMLPSGCDAAIVIAHQIAGSTDNFVAMMNAKAAALGMNDTHFTSPHGATDDPNNYSSVADLVALARYAMNNSTFRDIVSTQHKDLPAQTHRHAYTWDNTNQLLGTYNGADGIKTGSLLDWFCIVFSATRNGRRLIGAELGAPTPDLLYGDATRMLNKGFGS